jgi:hypothetical protein
MKTEMSLREIEELGFSLQDKICVFCSITTDRWNSFCGNCKEYKGLINIVEAVGYYGKEILPL